LAKRKTLSPWKPSRQQQLQSISRRVPDVIGPEVQILFCGINPGLYSAAVGHHFAGPGNLFWTTLHTTGFTPRLFTAFDEPEMLALGYGITNLVPRASASADDVDREELRAGARTVRRKVSLYKPKWLAVLGLNAYRIAFENTKAQVGLQGKIGSTWVYLLPNPSGLNAFHQPAVLNEMFVTFRAVVADAANGKEPQLPIPPADTRTSPKTTISKSLSIAAPRRVKTKAKKRPARKPS
jgi:double-stranded uracil-DNA glycosylase